MDRYILLKWISADGALSFACDKDNETKVSESYHQVRMYANEKIVDFYIRDNCFKIKRS